MILSVLLPALSLAGTLHDLGALVDNEYLRNLSPDPDATANAPNRLARQLVAISAEVCELLNLDVADTTSADFLKLFSGDDISATVPGFSASWATPYALSIYGQVIIPNGAGSRGDGYGDGRAISVGEVAIQPNASAPIDRFELQLKGAGRTPFCRNADGRAVLRSSTREFLASEAMAALGVPTTRALSLIASLGESVHRPWYRNASAEIAIGAHQPTKHGGDLQRAERCAITTRVARSFLRVGQFELYGRRASRGDAVAMRELEQLTRHAIRREYPNQLRGGAGGLQAEVLGMAREAVERFAHLAAEWLRVGYTQSNFNADNCLVGGVTVDYGPFGYIEKYDPAWAMWIGGGQHFSFANQPKASGANLKMLLGALEPLLNAAGVKELRGLGTSYSHASARALNRMWARKLGLPTSAPLDVAGELWRSSSTLLAAHPTDWTIFWRQLTEVAAAANQTDSVRLSLLEPAFYAPLDKPMRVKWVLWLTAWLVALEDEYSRPLDAEDGGVDGGMDGADGADEWDKQRAARSAARRLAATDESTPLTYAIDGVAIGDRMRLASPKYIPREWMLVHAYDAAERGEYGPLHELHALLRRPYDEQPEMVRRYYQRAPAGSDQQGGVGFMS